MWTTPAARASGLTHGTGPSSARSSLNVEAAAPLAKAPGQPLLRRIGRKPGGEQERADRAHPRPPEAIAAQQPQRRDRLPRTSSASTRAQHRSSPPRSRRRATNCVVTPPRPRAERPPHGVPEKARSKAMAPPPASRA